MKIKHMVRIACLSTVAALGLAAAPANAAVNLELGLAIDGSGSISAADFALQKSAYASVLNDVLVLPLDGTVAIGVKLFGTSVTNVFTTAVITNANIASLIAAINGMVQPASNTNIAGTIDAFVTEFNGNAINSAKQIIDVSTDGVNNIGNLATSKAAALGAGGIEQINCIGLGAMADCAAVQGGVGSFSVNAATAADFQAALKKKITIEIRGVPEAGTWLMMIFGFGVIGISIRRQSRNGIAQLA
jgi:Protein of unknown function (DUF1194)